MTSSSDKSRWTVVAIGTVVLLLAAIVPSPFRRRPSWQWVGPDKGLHLLGHAGYAVAIAGALADGGWNERDAAVGAVAGSTVHSLVTGRLQARVRGRADEPADVVAGLIGAASATLYWYHRADDRNTG